jgi:hypothetical protein
MASETVLYRGKNIVIFEKSCHVQSNQRQLIIFSSNLHSVFNRQIGR